MKLKDADVLREMMYHEAFETDSDMQKWDSGCWIRYKMFENVIEKVPTVEAKPIKHGKWDGKPIAGYSTVRCSICGTAYLENTGRWNYCPNCGADMRPQEEVHYIPVPEWLKGEVEE